MPMTLLDKTNPRATRRSVIHQSILWGAVTPALYLAACFWRPYLRPFWPVLLPVCAAFGAGIGALMEWQLDDGPDQPDEEDWRDAFDS